MPSPKALKNKLNKVLKKVGPPLRTVYKRQFTITGNALIGRETSTPADTLLSPQPLYRELTEAMVLSNNVVIPAGAYDFLLSADSVTLAELKSPNLQLVLKDADGEEDAMRIIHYTAPSLKGEAFMFTAYAESVSRK